MDLQMNIAQIVLTVFYAILWGTAANAQPRWRAFAWGEWRDPQTRLRIFLSVVLLNLLPIVYYVIALWLLRDWHINSWDLKSLVIVLLSIIPAFAPFGFYRIWIAIVQWNASKFYGPPQRWEEPGIKLTKYDLEYSSAFPNFCAGIVYIVLGLFIPLGANCLLLPN